MSENVYKPLLQEQETIIRFSEAEPCASVYTHNRKLMEKLLDMSREHPQIRLIAQDQYSACFSVPKAVYRSESRIAMNEGHETVSAPRRRGSAHRECNRGKVPKMS